MADDKVDLNELKRTALESILTAIPEYTHRGDWVLQLAMAYQVLNTGKLPGAIPPAASS